MRRARFIFTGGAVILAAGAAAIASSLWMQASPPAAAPSVPPAATAEVTRGSLLDTKTLTGTLSYGELSVLRPNLPDASVMVTWIAPVGAIVERGEPLYRLDGQPAILLYGSMPQHRTLRFDPGVADPVWVELEQAGIAVKSAELTRRLEQERLADAEARIVETTTRLEDALSPAPVTAEFIQLAGAVSTAEAKLGRVKELAAAALAPAVEIAAAEAERNAARAMFDAAVRALRQDLSGAGLDAVSARRALAEAEVKLDEIRTALDVLAARELENSDIGQIAENLAALGYEGPLSAQVRAWQRDAGLPVTGIVGPSHVIVAPGPVHIAAHGASIGEKLAASSPDRGAILDYSSTDKRVTVPLSVGDQRLAAIGRAVNVTLPDNRKVEGTISEVGSVVTNGNIEVIVTVADQAALGDLEVASVDIEFVSDRRDNVLSVPVAALLARPEGGFAVELVTGGTSAPVPVTTGLFAAGRVEVAGEGIAEGVRVGVPR